MHLTRKLIRTICSQLNISSSSLRKPANLAVLQCQQQQTQSLLGGLGNGDDMKGFHGNGRGGLVRPPSPRNLSADLVVGKVWDFWRFLVMNYQPFVGHIEKAQYNPDSNFALAVPKFDSTVFTLFSHSSRTNVNHSHSDAHSS